MEKYNGWTNWDTWNANLWLNNDEQTYYYASRCHSSTDLEKFWSRWFRNNPDEIDASEVNWGEIFRSLQED